MIPGILQTNTWEFHQIYNLDAVGDKGELIRFWGQKVKVQGHSKTRVVTLVLLIGRHFITYLWNAWTYFNEPYHNYSLAGPLDIDDVLKVMDLKFKVTDDFHWRYTDDNRWPYPCSVPGAGHLFRYVTNQPPKANSAFHPSEVGKCVPASAGKAKAGMVHTVSGWMRGVQVKLWDPLRTGAIPERLRDVITTRCCTNPHLPLPWQMHADWQFVVELQQHVFLIRSYRWNIILLNSYTLSDSTEFAAIGRYLKASSSYLHEPLGHWLL